jgi:hypothetical protein
MQLLRSFNTRVTELGNIRRELHAYPDASKEKGMTAVKFQHEILKQNQQISIEILSRI